MFIDLGFNLRSICRSRVVRGTTNPMKLEKGELPMNRRKVGEQLNDRIVCQRYDWLSQISNQRSSKEC